MLVIVRPSSDKGIELHDQISCCRLFVGLDERPHLAQEGGDVLARRLDDELALVLAYVLPQEIEAIVDVRDDGFLLGERQPSFPHELLDQGFDFLFEELS
jgi:hypothetical protein